MASTYKEQIVRTTLQMEKLNTDIWNYQQQIKRLKQETNLQHDQLKELKIDLDDTK